MRNKLAFDLFRDMPHIASLRTPSIHMTVTNQDALGVPYKDGAGLTFMNPGRRPG
jgi:hypothetical protein